MKATRDAPGSRDDSPFVRTLCHDLRGPMRRIYQLSELLGTDTPGENRNGFLHLIQIEARRGVELLDALTRYEHLPLPDESPTLCDVTACANYVVAGLPGIANKQFEVGNLYQVHMVEARLRFVLESILRNTIAFADERRALKVRCFAERSDTQLTVRITDNGIGIAREHQRTVFEAFRQVHGGDKAQGSGLGLFHCREVVTRSGGQIGVESEPRVGSTFWFTLPTVTY